MLLPRRIPKFSVEPATAMHAFSAKAREIIHAIRVVRTCASDGLTSNAQWAHPLGAISLIVTQIVHIYPARTINCVHNRPGRCNSGTRDSASCTHNAPDSSMSELVAARLSSHRYTRHRKLALSIIHTCYCPIKSASPDRSQRLSGKKCKYNGASLPCTLRSNMIYW